MQSRVIELILMFHCICIFES